MGSKAGVEGKAGGHLILGYQKSVSACLASDAIGCDGIRPSKIAPSQFHRKWIRHEPAPRAGPAAADFWYSSMRWTPVRLAAQSAAIPTESY